MTMRTARISIRHPLAARNLRPMRETAIPEEGRRVEPTESHPSEMPASEVSHAD